MTDGREYNVETHGPGDLDRSAGSGGRLRVSLLGVWYIGSQLPQGWCRRAKPQSTKLRQKVKKAKSKYLGAIEKAACGETPRRFGRTRETRSSKWL
jgi:hypothetical protein